MSLLKFEFVAQARLRLPSSFFSQFILLMVIQEKENLKLDVGKVVDNMTRGSCIPIDSVRISDDNFSLVHSIGTGACIDPDTTNPAHSVGSSYDMPG